MLRRNLKKLRPYSFLFNILLVSAISFIACLLTKYRYEYYNLTSVIEKSIQDDYSHYKSLASQIENGNFKNVIAKLESYEEVNIFYKDSAIFGPNRYITYQTPGNIPSHISIQKNGYFLTGQTQIGDSVLQYVFPIFIMAPVSNPNFTNIFPRHHLINQSYYLLPKKDNNSVAKFELGGLETYISYDETLRNKKSDLNINTLFYISFVFLIFTALYSLNYRFNRFPSARNITSTILSNFLLYLFFVYAEGYLALRDISIFQQESLISYFGFHSMIRYYYFIVFLSFLLGSLFSIYFSKNEVGISKKRPWNILIALTVLSAASIFFFINIFDMVFNSSLNFFMLNIYPLSPNKLFYVTLLIIGIYPLFACYHVVSRYLLKSPVCVLVTSIVLPFIIYYLLNNLGAEYEMTQRNQITLSLFFSLIVPLNKVKLFYINKRLVNWGNIFWMVYFIALMIAIFTISSNTKTKKKIESYIANNFVTIDPVQIGKIESLVNTIEKDKLDNFIDENQVKRYLNKLVAKTENENKNIKLIGSYSLGDDPSLKTNANKFNDQDLENFEILKVTETKSGLSIFQDPVYYVQIPASTQMGPITLHFKFENDLRYNSNFVVNSLFQEIVDKSFNYAIYEDGKLKTYYAKNFPEFINVVHTPTDKPLYFYYDNNILAYKDFGSKQMLVRTDYYNKATTLSTFIYFFIVFFLFYIFQQTVTLSATQNMRIRDLKGFSAMSFYQKLFISISAMVFILILTISIFVTRIYNENNKNSYNDHFSENVNTMSKILSNMNIDPGKINDDVVSRLKLFGYDFNIYNTDGKLLYSTNYTIFSNDLKTRYLNSAVLKSLSDRDNTTIFEEYLGKYNYYSGYSYFQDAGRKTEILNVLNLNYNEISISSVNKFFNQVAILIYILLFLSLLVSYLLSNNIRQVLQNLIQQIKGLDFQSYNKRLKWDQGDEIGVLVKEYNNMLDKLETNINLLKESERSLAWKDMARQIAHEVKNPLTPMKLNIQHLEKIAQSSPEKLQEITPKITQNLIQQINQLAEIASDFSFFSNITKAEKSEIELSRVYKASMLLYGYNEKVSFELIEPEAEVKLLANEIQLNNVYTNLIKNGIEAAQDREEIRISVSHEIQGDRIFIRFEDNGTGIPEDQQKFIFQPNFTTKSSGTGLGLVIVKNIVEYHQGTIEFQSHEGIGTTFILSFPIAV